jgi:hypothetical protein
MTVPTEKRQPNLLFASVRHLLGLSTDWPHFRQALLANADAVRSIMLTHSTQTNEPGRCATLLPVLAQLPQPLALIEVGASAGLCLLADHYGYDYGGHLVCAKQAEGGRPIFTCAVNRATPLPRAMPQIVWRAGLDLNPLNPTDPSQVGWLETLVWPEQTQRLTNLRAALRIAAARRPRNAKGDLLGDDLAQLCREAPKEPRLSSFIRRSWPMSRGGRKGRPSPNGSRRSVLIGSPMSLPGSSRKWQIVAGLSLHPANS